MRLHCINPLQTDQLRRSQQKVEELQHNLSSLENVRPCSIHCWPVSYVSGQMYECWQTYVCMYVCTVHTYSTFIRSYKWTVHAYIHTYVCAHIVHTLYIRTYVCKVHTYIHTYICIYFHMHGQYICTYVWTVGTNCMYMCAESVRRSFCQRPCLH